MYFLGYNLLALKKKLEWWLKEKENCFIYFFYIFYDLEGQGPLPTYPWGIETS